MLQSSALVDAVVLVRAVLAAADVVVALVPAPQDMACHIELARCKCNWLDMRPHHVRPAHP